MRKRIQRNLSGSKITTSSTKLAFFRPIGIKMAALASDSLRHLRLLLCNCWTKLDRKQDINVNYQVCDFGGDRKKKIKMVTRPLICWGIFDFSSVIAERNSTKRNRKQRSQRPLPSLYFSGRSKKKKQDCFLTSFVEFRSAMWEEKSKMSQPIRGRVVILLFFFSIGPKNTN